MQKILFNKIQYVQRSYDYLSGLTVGVFKIYSPIMKRNRIAMILLILFSCTIIIGCPTQIELPSYTFSLGITTDGTGEGVLNTEISTTNGVYEEGSIMNAEVEVTEGNEFLGWFNAEISGNLVTTDNPYSFGLYSNIALYASFNDVDPPYEIGDKINYSIGSTTFNLNYCPGGTFPSGISNENTKTVESFWIGELEITYEIWNIVYNWASSGTGGGTGEGQYTIQNAGTQGNGAENNPQHPVSSISWRDAMIWCNALTEYINSENSTSMTCFYYTYSAYTTPIRSCNNSGSITWESGTGVNDGTQDDPYIKENATGFRLPSQGEWEYAARYIDGNDWTIGNYASGANVAYNATPGPRQYGSDDVAIFNNNSGNSTAEVKTKISNALGLFDMSGNVFEWSFDWADTFEGTKRKKCGGSWFDTSQLLQIGINNVGSEPWMVSDDFGIRIIKDN